ncbi:fumarylacetoacetate hydrolase family protein [Pseudonocardia sp. McavD-2-B]|uniref:fumarylacetoacetate hydrolase family protein n=1 Tax=Pseudonocardia sp. McavD-2-B TaxID=2954499 RepID=UPI002097CB56|nr:fumarylacetoacetate hydrolase family protein [Pseudonocardia sp. McavD-2-B]MCO7194714.1 fumarylacetoacetate hydrolase family protein [Pseudonocardia sp. McavD-2-B]
MTTAPPPTTVPALALGAVAGKGRPGSSRIACPLPDGGLLDVGSLATAQRGPYPDLLAAPDLTRLLDAGAPAWREVVQWLRGWREDHERAAAYRLPDEGLVPVLPFAVADYVDFYACEQHARNAGLIFRPDAEDPLPPNWRRMPVGYHGRSGTVRVTGTPVARPSGQRGPEDFGPCAKLDFEAELGFVLGGPVPGPVGIDDAADHVFGVVLLNDWSARDIQFFESRPLGPHLGKSFATSISAWVTPLDELSAARVPLPAHDPAPLPYLTPGEPALGLDLDLAVHVNGELVASPPARDLYWSPEQMVAHLTSGGAGLRAGDLLGSGTVSGPERSGFGSMLELSWNGRDPVVLAGGASRTWLEDGDEVVMTATAPARDGGRVALGEVRGRIRGA